MTSYGPPRPDPPPYQPPRAKPEPDFDQIARTVTTEAGELGGLPFAFGPFVRALRQVWNARGAADRAEIDALKARVAELEAYIDDVPPGT